MATEIERKFLVDGDDWRKLASPGAAYRQGYLAMTPSCTIRVRVSEDKAQLTIKGETIGVSRVEYEYDIPFGDAESILSDLVTGPMVEKTRYEVSFGRHTWEIDVFEGDNAGLVVAEVELHDPDENFARPPWLGREVSHDERYYNARLALHPYKDWHD